MSGFNLKILSYMFTKPVAFWTLLKQKPPGIHNLVLFVLIPLVLLYSAALFAHLLISGNHIDAQNLFSVFLVAIISPVSVLFLSSWIIHRISKPLGTTTSFTENFSMLLYASLPYYFFHVLIYVLGLPVYFEVVGIYSIYIYYTACKHFIQIVERHFVSFIFISVFIFIAVNTIINYLIGGLHMLIYLN
jgi:hypothetical protein